MSFCIDWLFILLPAEIIIFLCVILHLRGFLLLGLYYDSFQNDIGAERAFLEATRANTTSIPKKTTSVAVHGEQISAKRKGSSK